MGRFLIRNDDISYATDMGSIKIFCEICDRYDFKVIQAIIPFGNYESVKKQNEYIRTPFCHTFREHTELIEYLKGRDDFIAVHGLWHTHEPSENEILIGKNYLQELGLKPVFYSPPFNEGDYPDEVAGLKTCKLDMAKGERLEDFLKEGTPTAPIMYLHSWRFGKWYRWSDLDRCLERLSHTQP